jgi:hypothetical protein
VSLTPEQRRVRRELERDYRRAQRKRVGELREHLRHAKRWRRGRLKKVRAICRHARLMARDAAKVIRARHRAAARLEVEALRKADREACEARKRQAQQKAASGVERAGIALASELQREKLERIWEKKPKMSRAGAARRRVELQQESDSEVEHNIPHELVPVWREVKRNIKATPRRTRTESFVEWANEHQARVREILDRSVEASIDQLIAAELEQRRELQRGARALGKLSDAELRRRHRNVSQELPAAPF